jgi:hypothetical protein
MNDPRHWLDMPALIERHGAIDVVRDDVLEGGSKLRFLPFLTGGASELVYGGPFCGGAALALSVIGREARQRVSLFYAKRARLHPRQRAALRNGAGIYQVAPGYLTNVQAKARAYAAQAGALMLPLGFDRPEAEAPLGVALAGVRRRVGQPAQVWVAAGSGMLARCLGRAFPESEICAVAVGLKSRHGAQPFGANVRVIDYPLDFAREAPRAAPFPSCPNYDAKAWEMCTRMARGPALFWNVLGPSQ